MLLSLGPAPERFLLPPVLAARSRPAHPLSAKARFARRRPTSVAFGEGPWCRPRPRCPEPRFSAKLGALADRNATEVGR